MELKLSVLRGVCQTPAYVAHELGYFREEGLTSHLTVAATAWQVPVQLSTGQVDFAVIPWTRVACTEAGDAPLVVCCGSGIEEAAIVLRKGVEPDQVRRVAVPREGGMKDMTALGLLDSLGWSKVELMRLPSGDGAILALVGQGVDAASMVEPYATMMEALDIGRVLRRTGDVWPGAPGCSLSTRRGRDAGLVAAVVRAYVRAIAQVHANPAQAAEIATGYIGVRSDWILRALAANKPDADAVRNQASMDAVLGLMIERGYITSKPSDYLDLRALDALGAQPRVLAGG